MTPRSLGQTTGVESVQLTTNNLPIHNHTLPVSGTTDMTGNGQAYTTMQPSLGLNYLMTLDGSYPPGGGSADDPTLGFVELFASNTLPQDNGGPLYA